MATVFISYRRGDSAGYAGRLHEDLERRLGEGEVFRDVDTLQPGEDFVRAINERVRQCTVFLVLIGREWLDVQDRSGRRRLEQDEDYVRLEIAAALGRDDLLVIPVLIEGASMPAAGDLPESIRKLAYRHAISLRDETWDADVDRLGALIAKHDAQPVRPAAADVRRAAGPRPKPPRGLMLAISAGIAIVVVLVGIFVRGPARPEDGGGTPDGAAASKIDPGTSPAAVRGPAYAIRIPRLAEIGLGSLTYTLISGSVGPHGTRRELRLRLRASNDGQYDANLWDAAFRLAVGQQVVTPTSGLNEILSGHSIQQAIVTFDIPPQGDKATLRITDGQATGEMPLDLSDTGRPAEDERRDTGDALSQAVMFPLQRDPIPLASGDGLAATLRRASGRRFANVVRLMFDVRFSNSGRYARGSGDLVLRLAAGDRVLAPAEAPNLVIEPAAEESGTYVFDVPPTTTRVVLRTMFGDTSSERPFNIP